MIKTPAPLLPPALFLIAGLIVGDHMAPSVFSFYACVMLAVLLFAVFAATHRSRAPISLAPLFQTLVLWLLVMSLGMFRMVQINHNNAQATASLSAAADDSEVFILGHVQKVQRPGNFMIEGRRLYVAAEAIPLQGNIQVFLEEEQTMPTTGQHLVLRGYLQEPAGPGNPGAFDYRSYLAGQNITHVFYANTSHLLDVPAQWTWTGFVEPLQSRLRTSLHQYVHNAAVRAVLFALLLGDTSLLTTTTREAFQQTGLMHLLAVSGLHVMLVGMVVYECLQPICLRLGFSWETTMWIRICFTAAVLFTYLLVTGAKPPVVRAVLMAVLFMVGQHVQRQTSSVNLLSMAAIALLLYNPANLFKAGFQLSFAAVLGILLLLPPFKQLLKSLYQRTGIYRYVADGVLVSVCASLGTLPVLLYHFSYVPLSGIVLNLVALPLTAAALSAGMCLLLAAPVSTSLAMLLGHAVTWITQGLLILVNKGAQFAFSLTPGTPDVLWLFFLSVCLLLLPGLICSPFRWRYAVALLTCANALIWTFMFIGMNRPVLTLTFFDVEHGDACLISFPNRKHMLVDTGGFIGDTSVAERILLPYLRFAGINSLDAVLLSHPHQDHTGGLPALVDAIPVSRVITAPDTSYALPVQAQRGFVHQTRLAGDTLHFDKTTRIRILAPDSILNTDVNPNTRSLFFQLRYGQTSVLFTGDATAETEQFVARHFPAFLYGHIVKVPHHGSETSSTVTFLRALASTNAPLNIAVVSTGPRRRYGLPDEVVVNRWRNTGAQIHNTATAGALIVKSDGVQFETLVY